MRRTVLATAASAGILLATGGMLSWGHDDDRGHGHGRGHHHDGWTLSGTFENPDGAEIGWVRIGEDGDNTRVSVRVSDLEPGFHAFHVHAIGECDPDSENPSDAKQVGDFLSAGGHLGAGQADHGMHVGDLPSLFVDDDGRATLAFWTDAFDTDDLLDKDGSAVMIHAGRDNFANIPTRYAPDGPDAMTRATGDAGGRVACAVVDD
jgi:superoxide dismutase, Cu-Zn family